MLRYANGDEILDGDLCTTVHRATFVRLYFVVSDGVTLRLRELLSTRLREIKPKDFVELKSGKGKKHDNLNLIMRKDNWTLILNKLAEKANKIDLDKDFSLPDNILEAWTRTNKR